MNVMSMSPIEIGDDLAGARAALVPVEEALAALDAALPDLEAADAETRAELTAANNEFVAATEELDRWFLFHREIDHPTDATGRRAADRLDVAREAKERADRVAAPRSRALAAARRRRGLLMQERDRLTRRVAELEGAQAAAETHRKRGWLQDIRDRLSVGGAA